METHSFFEDLAELSPGTPVFVGDREINLEIEAIIGYGELPLAEHTLRVKLKNFYVHLISPNTITLPSSRYEAKLQKFLYEGTTSSSRIRSRKGQGDLTATVGGQLSWVPSFFGRLRAAGKVEVEGKTITRAEETKRREIALITPLPKNRWLAGDVELGDIRKIDGCLHGTYFQEARAEGINEFAPLCSLQLKPGIERFTISLALVAKSYDLKFELVHRWGNHDPNVGLSEKEDFAQQLKAAVAGVVLSKALKKAQNEFDRLLQNHELLICLATLNENDVLPQAQEL